MDSQAYTKVGPPIKYRTKVWQTSLVQSACNGTWSQQYGLGPLLTRDSYVASGLKNPGWRDLVARGVDAGSTYNRSGSNISFGVGNMSVAHTVSNCSNGSGSFITKTRISNSAGWDISVGNVPGVNPEVEADAARKADDAYIRALSGTYELFNSGAFFGELSEALRTIRSPFATLRASAQRHMINSVNRVKKSARGSKRQKYNTAVRIITDSYLETVYGWSPLIGDINGAISVLVNHRKQGIKRVSSWGNSVARGYSVNPGGSTSGSTTLFGHAVQGMETRSTSTNAVYITDTFAVRYNSEGSGNQEHIGVAQSLGLSLHGAVVGVYNLIPYSFLLDYVSNAQEVIASIVPPNVNLAWHYRSTKKVRSIKSELHIASANGGSGSLVKTLVGYSPCSCTNEEYSFSRTKEPVTQVTPIEFHLELPNLKKILNMAMLGAANATASRQIQRHINL